MSLAMIGWYEAQFTCVLSTNGIKEKNFVDIQLQRRDTQPNLGCIFNGHF